MFLPIKHCHSPSPPPKSALFSLIWLTKLIQTFFSSIPYGFWVSTLNNYVTSNINLEITSDYQLECLNWHVIMSDFEPGKIGIGVLDLLLFLFVIHLNSMLEFNYTGFNIKSINIPKISKLDNSYQLSHNKYLTGLCSIPAFQALHSFTHSFHPPNFHFRERQIAQNWIRSLWLTLFRLGRQSPKLSNSSDFDYSVKKTYSSVCSKFSTKKYLWLYDSLCHIFFLRGSISP